MKLSYAPVDLNDDTAFADCAAMRRDIYILGEGTDRRMYERWPVLESFRDWLREKQAIKSPELTSFVRDEKANIVAHFILYPEKADPSAAFLDLLYIQKPYRGQRLGATILKHIEVLAAKHGFKKLVFTSIIAREGVTAFYKSCGCTLLGTQPDTPILYRWEKSLA